METNWKFHHVAVVVRDMDREVERYEFLGVGTFRPEFLLDSSKFLDYKVYGKTPDTVHKSRFRHNDIGPDKFDLEFIAPIEGEPIYRDFLRSKGEGVHHLAFTVDDLEQETARLTEKGIPVLTSVKRETGTAFTYFDLGNIIIELIQLAK